LAEYSVNDVSLRINGGAVSDERSPENDDMFYRRR
jgi:hypothetical protein